MAGPQDAFDQVDGDPIEAARLLAGYLLTSIKSDAMRETQRQRLTARGQELEDALIATWMQLLGEVPGWHTTDDGQRLTPAEVVEQLTVVAKARTDPIVDGKPLIGKSVALEDVFADIGRWLAGQELFEALIARLERATDAQLEWARDDVNWLGEAFQGFLGTLQHDFGFDAGGLGELSLLANPREAHQFALISVLGLELGRQLVRPLPAAQAVSSALVRLLPGPTDEVGEAGC